MIRKNVVLVLIVVVCVFLIFKYGLTDDNESDSIDDSNIETSSTNETTNNTTFTSQSNTLDNNENFSSNSTTDSSNTDKVSIFNREKKNENSETNSEDFSSYTKADYIKEVMNTLSQKIKLQTFPLVNNSSSSSNYNTQNKNITLTFKTLLDPTCHLGDIDAMYFDNTKNPNLVASIEDISVTENNLYPIINIVSVKELENTTLYFDIPKPSTAILAGLFICKDAANDRKCNNKASYDISQLLKYYSLTTNITNPSILKDKIYFFQTLIITPETLYILDTTQTNKDMNELKTTLKKILGTEDSILKAQIQRIKSLNKHVYSKNVVIEKNTLTLSLPKQDKSVCNQ